VTVFRPFLVRHKKGARLPLGGCTCQPPTRPKAVCMTCLAWRKNWTLTRDRLADMKKPDRKAGWGLN